MAKAKANATADVLGAEKRRVIHLASFSKGTISVASHEPQPVETIQLLERFATVFDQTYTRFLDLQKAEAQAREAQIEAALEKVRSSSLAMHKSDELNEVVTILFEKIKELQMPVTAVGIGIYIDGSKDMDTYVCGENEDRLVINNYRLPYFRHKIWKDLTDAREKHLNFFSGNYSKEEKNSFYNYVIEHSSLRHLPDDIKSLIFESPAYIISMAPVNHSMFMINDFEGKILSENEVDVIKRFARVFDQTYTRFLDLQKAEAQARESQIELGLERVRARAMAMQNSDELKELIGIVFIELTKLDLVLTRCLIMIYDPKTNGSTWWMANSEAPTEPIGLYIKYHEHSPYLAYINAWREREYKWQYILEGTVKKEWDDFLFVETELSQLPDFVIAGMKAPNKVYLNSSFNNFGNLTLASLEPLSDEHFDILLRFAKVFDLTYTRFNDLQKAEAQAREAQIEAALERVRSRSMAMHKSDELKEVIRLVLDQFVHLNIKVEHAGFYIDYKTHDDMHIWLADPNLEPFFAIIPYFDTPTWNSFIDAKASGKTFHTDLLDFEEKNKFYKSLFKLFTIPEEAKEFYLQCKGLAVSTVLLGTVGLYIENFSGIPYTDEENKILMRFGNVFQQTYTRFLDLQKAEIQARESQIQLALERARAQSMMMQHSKELDDVLRVFHEQVLLLRIPSAFSFLWLPDEEKDRHIFWAAWAENNLFKSKAINYPLDRNEPATAQCLVDWKSSEPVVSYQVPPEGVANYFAAWSELISGVDELQPQHFSDGLYYVEAFMKHGCFGVIVKNPLAEDEKQILERLATEFEQTYTRFLDLQKAEAQAREAQIETSLERLRSKTMAMHNSSEVGESVACMFAEFVHLGISTNRCGILIFKDETLAEVWTAKANADG
ncbi:MAG: hypothetical protein K2U26_11670, partial [Cyclobacteriaceae bacterium]|nr:hypothetical protein [Cyclobacteriaceae bacterium]